MTGFAIYRLPHERLCRLVEGETQELIACTELNERKGFVVAPFEVRADQPVMLIQADRVEQGLPEEMKMPLPVFDCNTADNGTGGDDRRYYAIDFANFHAQLQQGHFRKLVLARCADEPRPTASPIELFRNACERYPRMMISLTYTHRSGLWLTATPEILLESYQGGWRTIALAGTMKLSEEQMGFDNPSRDVPISWTTKNIQEQRFVATYLTEQLEQFTQQFREEGPYTVRAANLVHLRSDFTFSLPDTAHLGDLLQALHPTPAVCGLPKQASFRFIIRNEHTPRRYYSGFMGMLDPEGDTHLYVSLRCMNIGHNCCHLYAGGGLLPDSKEEQEWQETEAKLETMRLLMHNS